MYCKIVLQDSVFRCLIFSKINLENNALPKVYDYINIIDWNISFVFCHETKFLYALNYLWLSIPVFLPGESMDREAWWAIVHSVTGVGYNWSDFAWMHTLHTHTHTHTHTYIYIERESFTFDKWIVSLLLKWSIKKAFIYKYGLWHMTIKVSWLFNNESKCHKSICNRVSMPIKGLRN